MLQLSDSIRKSAEKSLVVLYSIGAVGAFLQIAGANWDISAHILGIVETFFTPAHGVLYSGIVLVAFANLLGLRLSSKLRNDPTYSRLLTGTRIATFGSILQFVAAPLDFWWHSTYGFDPFLFTPAHSILIVGMIIGGSGMTLGAVRLLQTRRSLLQSTGSTRYVPAITALVLAAFWAQMNFASYWITDTYGMAYTFGLCSIPQFTLGTVPCSFVNQYQPITNLLAFMLFGASGSIIFWATKSLFKKRGVFSGIAAIIVAMFSATSIGFMAYALDFLNPPGTWYLRIPSHALATQFASGLLSNLPAYILFLIPVLVLDLAIKNQTRLSRLLLLTIPVAPFIAFLDRFARGIYSLDLVSLGIIVAITVIGGVLGSILLSELRKKLSTPIPAEVLQPPE